MNNVRSFYRTRTCLPISARRQRKGLKVGADRDVDGKLIQAQRPEQLRAQVEANLTGLIAQGDQKVGLDSQLAELTALRQAGKIGAIGLSNVSAD